MKLKFYPFILTTVLAIVNVFLFYQIINFESKYEVLNTTFNKVLENKKLENSDIQIQKFKEDSYIRHQQRDTNLILTVFTLFAGFVAFITYRGFISEVERNSANMKEITGDYERKYNEQHKIILELKSRLDIDNAQKFERSAFESYENKFYGLYLENMLYSVKYYTDFFLHIIETEGDSSGLLTHEQTSTLEEIYNKIKKKSVEGVSLYSTYKNIKDIRQFNNREVDKYLDLISAKITRDNPNKKAPIMRN